MSSILLGFYHGLPPVLRSVVASVRGAQLARRRYGPETDALARAASEREYWARDRWENWQAERLAGVLERASSLVPYYTAHGVPPTRLAEARGRGSLPAWPVLRKQAVRESAASFLANDRGSRRLWQEHTSGSTGTPLAIWQSRETVRGWYALCEARWRRWYGVSRHDRWAILGGQLVVPVGQKKPPYWVSNRPLHQLYLSSYHIGPDTAAAYLAALREHRVAYLWGYASSLYSLAVLAREQGLETPPMKVVISNAEPLYQHHREVLAEVFHCPVRDTYGMSEMVCAASECEAGTMHLWPEVGVCEVLKDESDEPVQPGEAGRLVATGLLNQDMLLVRFEVGDRVAIAPAGQTCTCGRTLPILLSVEGRNDDTIVTPDGRRVGRLDPVFKADFGIKEAQIVQETWNSLLVTVVPSAGYSEAGAAGIVSALKNRVGEMRISLQTVKEIPRGANGKFRAVVSKCGPKVKPSEGAAL